MNFKKIIVITLIAFFAIGIIVSAADAAHTVKKGKYTVKLSNKEYKKLTAEETKYKTVQKLKTVKKIKKVNKTKTVKKTKTETKNGTAYILQDNFTLEKNGTIEYGRSHYGNYTLTYNTTNDLIKTKTGYWDYEDYILVESNTTYYPESKFIYDYYFPDLNAYYSYDAYNTNHCITNLSGTNKEFEFRYVAGESKVRFEKNSTYNVTESYTVDEPYYVTEKYNVKVPYKVRKDVSITKKVPKKYVTIKEIRGVKVKTVKVPKTIGKYKYVGRTYFGGIKTAQMKKDMDKRFAKLKKAGWKINTDDQDIVIGSDGSIYHYCYCTKKVYKKEKWTVGNIYKKVKKPVLMSISSCTEDGIKMPKGKVHVTIFSCDGPISEGTVTLK